MTNKLTAPPRELPQPEASSLWLFLNSQQLAIVRYTATIETKLLVVYSLSKNSDELLTHPLETWYQVACRYDPLATKTRAAHTSYQLILMSLEARLKEHLMQRLGADGAGLSTESLMLTIEALEKIAFELSCQPNEILGELFGYPEEHTQEAMPELAMESISRLALIHDGVFDAAGIEDSRHSIKVLLDARGGKMCCVEIEAYAAIASSLVKMQVQLGRVREEDYAEQLAEVMTWPLIGYPVER
jgi:hypothetical protein